MGVFIGDVHPRLGDDLIALNLRRNPGSRQAACAEQLGGLPTPRVPAEIQGDKVVSKAGVDVTYEYTHGAQEVLLLAKLTGCKKALLKERSPSCGHGIIYDGTFTGTKIPGDGVTARLLAENGLTIYRESNWEDLL